MATVLLTEDSNKIIAEPAAGITGASTRNDMIVRRIYKEDFDTDPADNGWLLGTQWAWNPSNDNVEFTP